jgi:hypothetical protein
MSESEPLSIELSDEVLATHADLSPAAADLLAYVAADPAVRARPLPPVALPDWMAAYPMQAWPVLLGAEKRRQIASTTAGVTRLVKSVFGRVFAHDPVRLDRYFRLGDVARTAKLFAPPDGLAGAVGRCDFVDTGRDLKFLEFNVGGTVGGWEMRFWERHYRSTPVLAGFFAEHGLAPAVRDTWVELLGHLLAEVESGPPPADATVNVALVIPSAVDAGGLALFNDVYRRVLTGSGLAGRIVTSDYPGTFTVDGGRLACGGVPVDVLVEVTEQDTPPEIYDCFKAGGLLRLYNGPLSRVLGDKRLLALLSEHAGSGLFDAAERELIARCIPWTRTVEDRVVAFQGAELPLLELLRRERGCFVLKPGEGQQGRGVLVGPHATPEAWEAALASATADGTWVAQEVVTSRPYLGQAGEVGAVLHDVVWGAFCFGERYGGGFLRMMPRGAGDGVINSARGASEGLILEV